VYIIAYKLVTLEENFIPSKCRSIFTEGCTFLIWSQELAPLW